MWVTDAIISMVTKLADNKVTPEDTQKLRIVDDIFLKIKEIKFQKHRKPILLFGNNPVPPRFEYILGAQMLHATIYFMTLHHFEKVFSKLTKSVSQVITYEEILCLLLPSIVLALKNDTDYMVFNSFFCKTAFKEPLLAIRNKFFNNLNVAESKTERILHLRKILSQLQENFKRYSAAMKHPHHAELEKIDTAIILLGNQIHDTNQELMTLHDQGEDLTNCFITLERLKESLPNIRDGEKILKINKKIKLVNEEIDGAKNLEKLINIVNAKSDTQYQDLDKLLSELKMLKLVKNFHDENTSFSYLLQIEELKNEVSELEHTFNNTSNDKDLYLLSKLESELLKALKYKVGFPLDEKSYAERQAYLETFLPVDSYIEDLKILKGEFFDFIKNIKSTAKFDKHLNIILPYFEMCIRERPDEKNVNKLFLSNAFGFFLADLEYYNQAEKKKNSATFTPEFSSKLEKAISTFAEKHQLKIYVFRM